MVARNILASWERSHERFVKVIPRDYKRAVVGAGQAEAVQA